MKQAVKLLIVYGRGGMPPSFKEVGERATTRALPPPREGRRWRSRGAVARKYGLERKASLR